MKAADAILFALENLSSRRMRTGLSTLGMMFGVAAVIAMLSIGAGAEKRAMALIERLGVNNVLIKSNGGSPGTWNPASIGWAAVRAREASQTDSGSRPVAR